MTYLNDLNEIQARADAAMSSGNLGEMSHAELVAELVSDCWDDAEATFFAAARSDVPRLVAELQRTYVRTEFMASQMWGDEGERAERDLNQRLWDEAGEG